MNTYKTILSLSAKTNTINNNTLTSEEITRYNVDLYKIQNTKLSPAQYKENKISFVIQIPKDIRKIKRSFFYLYQMKTKKN